MNNFQFDYNQYKKKLNKHLNLDISVATLIIILLFGVAFFVYSPIKTKKLNFYFLEVGSFLNYTQAQQTAELLQNNGGAGLVYFNNKYRVLACAYVEHEQATTVKNNIKADYSTAKVLTLSTDMPTLHQFSKKEKTLIWNTIKTNTNLFKQLFNSVMDYESNNITHDKFILNIKNILLTFQQQVDNFENNFNNNLKTERAKQNLNNAKNCLNSILNNTENFCQNCKLQLTKFSVCCYSFLESFC